MKGQSVVDQDRFQLLLSSPAPITLLIPTWKVKLIPLFHKCSRSLLSHASQLSVAHLLPNLQHLSLSTTMNEGGHSRSAGTRRRSFSKELLDLCQSDALSEEGIREIIQRYGLTPNSHDYDVREYTFFHRACYNDLVTEGIIRCLLEYFPAAARVTINAWSPLHFACYNKKMTPGIIQQITDAHPNSVRSEINHGLMPLHILCATRNIDEAAATEILKLLIKKYPEPVRHATNSGCLPIHIASVLRSNEFCRVLIDAYPGSLRIPDPNGELPLHLACAKWAFPTVKYLYNLFPNAIHHASTDGVYPIHTAIVGRSSNNVDTAIAAVEIVKFLLACDPNVKLQRCEGIPLLLFACGGEYQNIDAGIQMINAIYDAHPEAIEDIRDELDIENCHQQVQAFMNGELFYARQAEDHRLMATPDDIGRLPLHTAIESNVRLGSIKLLVKGNLAALQCPDSRGALPLHVACQHHDSSDVIDYLVGLDPSTLEAVHRDGNTALHLACRNARHDIITLFLEEYGAVSVSTRNADGKLPIDLLWESTAVEERSIEYTESVYRLLRANPEMMMGIDVQTMQASASVSTLPCQAGKKRKFGQ